MSPKSEAFIEEAKNKHLEADIAFERHECTISVVDENREEDLQREGD